MAKTGYVYILTNRNKTVLYIGVTNDIQRRLLQHVHEPAGFVKRYNVQFCVRFESINGMLRAIQREKELKGWTRAKKNTLVATENPDWNFLNEEILGDC